MAVLAYEGWMYIFQAIPSILPSLSYLQLVELIMFLNLHGAK